MSSYSIFIKKIINISNHKQNCLIIKNQIFKLKWRFLYELRDKMRLTKNKLSTQVEFYH